MLQRFWFLCEISFCQTQPQIRIQFDLTMERLKVKVTALVLERLGLRLKQDIPFKGDFTQAKH